MNIFGKIFSALKSGAMEMGEPLVDTGTIDHFEQELAKATAELEQAKASKAKLQALCGQTQAKLSQLAQQISQCENQGEEALNRGDEVAALKFATQIAELDVQHNHVAASFTSHQQNLQKLSQQISKAELDLIDMQNQLSQVKATESVHQAQESLHTIGAENGSGSPVSSAKQSLAKIKQKQAELDAQIDVNQQLKDDDLDSRLSAAGITESPVSQADKVLARLKQKQANTK